MPDPENLQNADQEVGNPSSDYQDTIALLQEEIARLEDEIRLRDEARAESPYAPINGTPEESREMARVAELTAEIAHRDETINWLFEQCRLLEEAEAASRAEFEQLDRWMSEVEQRVES